MSISIFYSGDEVTQFSGFSDSNVVIRQRCDAHQGKEDWGTNRWRKLRCRRCWI